MTTPSKSRQKLLKSVNDFVYFCREIMNLEMMGFHRKIAHGMEYKRLLLMVARQHGKTELAIAKALHFALFNKKKKIIIVSSCMGQSTAVLERLKHKIDDTPELRILRPKYAGFKWEDWKATWQKQEITTSTGCKIICKPFSPSLRGETADLFVLDDILRDEKGKAVMKIEDVKRILANVIFPITYKQDAPLFIIGTPIAEHGEEDLLFMIRRELSDIYHVIFLPACKCNEEGSLSDPIWPSQYPVEKLKKMRKEMNTVRMFSFEQELLLQPMAAGTSIFTPEILKKAIVNLPPINKPRPNCWYYAGVDVAISEAAEADFTVITILEIDEHDVGRVRKFYRDQGTRGKKILEELYKFHEIFNFSVIVIEDKGLSKDTVRMAQEDAKIEVNGKMVPNTLSGVTEGFKTTRPEKERIISNIRGGMSSGSLFIPNNVQLLRELRRMSFTKDHRLEAKIGHDDMVISLALAYEAFIQFGARTTVSYL